CLRWFFFFCFGEAEITDTSPASCNHAIMHRRLLLSDLMPATRCRLGTGVSQLEGRVIGRLATFGGGF
ncbi:hypothetical protein, partial [Tritonibacter sp. SIMBA_163]|uniref:hypothetical protein n=1 Tax=Tritonibacter sp. SIMBA_163 TaxID=3080868 RepID=UPI0039813540